MPIYSYQHSSKGCNFGQEFYLKKDVSSVIVPCFGCGAKITARKVEDKSLHFGEDADGTVGITQREVKGARNSRNRQRK